MHLASLLLAVVITADTSNPTNSFFRRGEAATVSFAVSEIPPGKALKLESAVYDEHDRKVADLPALDVSGGADGKWTGSLPLPTGRYGYYCLRAKCGGAELPKVGTRPPRCITYAVVFDPDKRKRYPDDWTFYGLMGGGPDVDRWFGTTFHFASATPLSKEQIAKKKSRGQSTTLTPGTISAGNHENLAKFMPPEGKAFCASNGIRSVNLWNYLKSPETEKWYRFAMSEMIKAAKEQVVGRRIYEITGEPDMTAPSPDVVVKFSRLAHDVISKEDPEAIICGAMVSTFSAMEYHRRLFDLGLADCIDAFGIHQYMPIPAEPSGILQKIRGLRRMVREKKGRDIPMYGGEGGFCISSTIQNDLVKMNGLVRAQLIMLGEGMNMSNIYYPADHGRKDATPDAGDYGLTFNLEYPKRRYGPHKVSPRPVAAALAAATRFTEGHRSTGCLEGCFGDTSLGYSYATADDECVIAVWDWGVGGSVAELNVGRGEIVVADVMGNERTVKTKDGVLRLALDESPQYVLDPDPALWGRKGTEASRMQALARERAAAREAAREIAFVSLAPGVAGDGGLYVAGEVENRRKEPTDVVFETRVRGRPDARGSVSARLKPGETRRLAVPLPKFRPGAFERMTVEASVTTASGFSERMGSEENFYAARYVPAGPGGDVFADWTAPLYEPAPGGDADCSMKLAIAWNDKFIMFDVVVEDDDYSPSIPGALSWNGDAIQLGLAKKALLKSTENTLTDLYQEGMTETTFALTTKGPQAYRTKSFEPKRFPQGYNSNDPAGLIDPADCPFEVKPSKNASGGWTVRYRMAVPWAFMNRSAAPAAGESARFALWVCDRDAGDKVARHGVKLFDFRRASAPKRYGRVIMGAK